MPIHALKKLKFNDAGRRTWDGLQLNGHCFSSRYYENRNRRLQSTLAGSSGSIAHHLILFSRQPAELWPPRLELQSILFGEMSKRWKRHHALSKLQFSLAQGAHHLTDESNSIFGSSEEYGAILYSSDYISHVPFPISLSTLENFETLYSSVLSGNKPSGQLTDTHIFVCCHGSRDCRCEIIGNSLYNSLQEEFRRRHLFSNPLHEIKVNKISHIGGHKFAGMTFCHLFNLN
jgi:lipoyl synthase